MKHVQLFLSSYFSHSPYLINQSTNYETIKNDFYLLIVTEGNSGGFVFIKALKLSEIVLRDKEQKIVHGWSNTYHLHCKLFHFQKSKKPEALDWLKRRVLPGVPPSSLTSTSSCRSSNILCIEVAISAKEQIYVIDR